MRRKLSARSTTFSHALPALWLLAVASCAWLLRSEPRILPMLVPVALIPPLLMRWQTGRLRHVSTDGRLLYARKGRREIAIPFSEIADVREIRGTGPNRGVTVVLTLRSPTPLGQEICFVPRMRWWPDAEALGRAQALQGSDPDAAAMALWGSFSAAEEIRQRVRAESQAGASAGTAAG